MDYPYSKFYQLGNGRALVFEKDLEELSMYLKRPFPEFFGAQLDDQDGGELRWLIVADLRGKQEPPTSDKIRFNVRETTWSDGLARAMQEALAHLCGQNSRQLRNTRFEHYAKHTSLMTMTAHPELKHHVYHLNCMLQEVRKELDNSRAYINAHHQVRSETASTITILARERKTLCKRIDTKNLTIACLLEKIASLEQTIEDQEKQLEEVEEEGIDLRRENAAFLSDDDDYVEEMDMMDDEDDDEEVVEEEEE